MKASLKIRVNSLVISSALALFVLTSFPLHLLWGVIPQELNIVGFIVLFTIHVIFLVLGVLFVQQRTTTLGNFLLTSAAFFCVVGIVSWFGLTYFYSGAVGSGLRIYFVLLPLIFSIFNGFAGDLLKNLIRYVGLFFAYTLLLVLA